MIFTSSLFQQFFFHFFLDLFVLVALVSQLLFIVPVIRCFILLYTYTHGIIVCVRVCVCCFMNPEVYPHDFGIQIVSLAVSLDDTISKMQ